MSDKKNAKDLDQFFTDRKISKVCLNNIKTIVFNDLGYSIDDCVFLEPSTGDGSFVDALKEAYHIGNDRIIAADLDPKQDYIVKHDFLIDDLSYLFNNTDFNNVVVVGNPPFGKRSKLAIDFLNTSFKYSDSSK